ncbi:asparagine synthetase domain-containing protein CG17486 [Aricia agestis]|uniref:asparagine synthetase domain-containing protein CG17486 n=1 Tax=Aricia agestis TaxID=91739 RepID=UPI001C20510E|nr:asparagine synthetase domain-containing protein CG17486 [Aricia agestis]
MCGILCEIIKFQNAPSKTSEDTEVQSRIQRRGPDHMSSVQYLPNDNLTLWFCGSVLWMQGKQLTPQPIENEYGILLFNGDIFDETWNTAIASDTHLLMNQLTKESTCQHIISVIKGLKGPFSLVYYCKVSQLLYFTRDRIGRNSLLIHNSEDTTIIGSVLGRKYSAAEIPARLIYKLDLKTDIITTYNWHDDHCFEYSFLKWLETVHKEQSSPDEAFTFDLNEAECNNSGENIEDNVITFIEEISQSITEKHDIFKHILENSVILNTVCNLTNLLEKSIKIRVQTQPLKCKNCISLETDTCNHSATGILFSGGLDCTILALIADKYVPKNQSIDLLNVAFESKKGQLYEVPDRLTGRQSFEELKKICPLRTWIFREINVPIPELKNCQQNIICDLVYPRRTILDESLGSALWFAVRGQDDKSVSPCRIVIVGSGADELFGGYIRHRNALKRHGWAGLSKELLLDWKRISFRNLARDNRVICDHGRQPRMPYLDEDFVNYVIKLKPWLRCFPSQHLNVGIGDKLFLRLVAYQIGLLSASTLPKRAIQFGSRIANNKQNGSDISKIFK